MENASKALLMAASTLIAVMLLSFMVYMFRRFGDISKTTEKKLSQREIDAFNSKFINYDTGGEHSINDTITITYARNNPSSSGADSKSFSYDNILGNNTNNLFSKIPEEPTNKNDPNYENDLKKYNDALNLYYKSLISVSNTLNKPSDVVTAINDAININYKNNNEYRYNSLEIQNSIEIAVDLEGYKNEFSFSKIKGSSDHYRYLVIEPNKNVKDKCIYGMKSSFSLPSNSTNNTNNKITNVNNLKNMFINDINKNDYNAISVYDILTELRDTKVITDQYNNNKTYTVYKYYFIGETFVNEFTGLIESIEFTLVKDNNF